MEPYVDAGPSGLIGCGLGGPEIGFPPEPFADAFAASRRNGMRLTAHAGESAGPDSIWSAIRSLDVERIGHGVACAGDDQLVDHIVTHGVRVLVRLCCLWFVSGLIVCDFFALCISCVCVVVVSGICGDLSCCLFSSNLILLCFCCLCVASGFDRCFVLRMRS